MLTILRITALGLLLHPVHESEDFWQSSDHQAKGPQLTNRKLGLRPYQRRKFGDLRAKTILVSVAFELIGILRETIEIERFIEVTFYCYGSKLLIIRKEVEG